MRRRRPQARVVSASRMVGYSAARIASTADSGCDQHPSRAEERAAVAADFAHFLPRWWFVNRESGVPMRFDRLWPGQERAVDAMSEHAWLLLLKAGKLGFTELECAYDGWVALYRHQNARVHLFSLDLKSAQNLLGMVKFGIAHLPDWLGLPFSDGPGADTTTQIRLRAGPDDTRSVISYPAVKDAAIDQTAHHSHVDELARMPWPEETWSAVESTVAPGGSAHIVSRGAGDSNIMKNLWDRAKAGGSPLHPHFEAWDARPRVPAGTVPEGVDPSAVWYAEREAGMLQHQLNWLAPRTAEDALSGSGEDAFVTEPQWLGCYDPALPPLVSQHAQTGALVVDQVPLVLGVDAGVTNDLFAAVAVSRHPDRPDDPAVRAVKVWRPPPGGAVDFPAVERWIRLLCLGGCLNGHPSARRGENPAGAMCAEHAGEVAGHGSCGAPGVPCDACAGGNLIPAHNVQQVAFDQYQLVNMMQTLTKDRVVWCRDFPQGGDRLEADGNLRTLIVQRRLAHNGDATLTEHVKNANARTDPKEDTKLRLVKRAPDQKIDAAVALSMAVSEALRLNLAPLVAA